MQLNSLQFIFEFLPIFLVIYHLIKAEFRGITLLAGSIIFYWLVSGEDTWWVAVLAAAVLVTYLGARWLTKSPKKSVLWLFVFIQAGALLFFKVYEGGQYLPAGMSFYLFQAVAILVDVYRGKLRVDSNVVGFCNHLVMFPKLLSGPIGDPVTLHEQENRWSCDWQRFGSGVQCLILGLGMKVILAGRMGGIWSQANLTGFSNISTVYAWIAVVAWTMELYLDFYGYSLMAVGLGRMLGYELPHNFLNPYASASVSEFYRRWHVTLGAWFREYMYIPLGGNRKGTFRTILNLWIVWLFTGLWHGVGGNYLIWAMFLFLLIVNERLWLKRVLQKIGFLRHVYVIFAILLSWVPFAVSDFGQMLQLLTTLFGGGTPINPLDYMELTEYIPMLLAGAFLATPVPEALWKKIRSTPWAFVILFAVFWAVVYLISTAAQDPFMYFQY